jgi:hypothetical protein
MNTPTQHVWKTFIKVFEGLPPDRAWESQLRRGSA